MSKRHVNISRIKQLEDAIIYLIDSGNFMHDWRMKVAAVRIRDFQDN